MALAPKKPQISLQSFSSWWCCMRNKLHQEELNRQKTEQAKLEAAMNRQEPQTQRDQQLEALDKWLDKQEKRR
jgi:hypothetical protein